jgi:hypothetical protein
MRNIKEIKYKMCQFIHKDEKYQYVIHDTDYTQEYFHDYSLQEIKADIERITKLVFIKDEDKLIERKLQERKDGIRKQEKYLLLR